MTEEHDARVLEAIHYHSREISSSRSAEKSQHPTQRDIAHAVGLSLGMTNAILKRLAKKGFVTMKRINGRNIHYLVTPEGIEMIATRSYRYLRRTVGHIVRYKERMRSWLRERKGEGISRVVLVGETDLDFLVEWCVEAEEMIFLHAVDAKLVEDLQEGVPHGTIVLSGDDESSFTTDLDSGPIPITRILIPG